MAVLAAFCLLLLLVNGHAYNGRASMNDVEVVTNEDPTYYGRKIGVVFSQQWPKGVCQYIKQIRKNTVCNLPSTDEWTIHGIWPSYYMNEGPSYCNMSLKYDEEALKELKPNLETKWMSIYNKSDSKFWEHEWEKHGTCATSIPKLNGIVNYFSSGLNFAKKLDVKKMLERRNIIPGRSCYNYYDILNAITSSVRVVPYLKCHKSSNNEDSVLNEVHFCFNGLLQLINCTSIQKVRETCPTDKCINYPSIFEPQLHSVIRV